MQAFQAKYPRVQVDVFRSGTEEVMARLNTEAQAGALGADVMLQKRNPATAKAFVDFILSDEGQKLEAGLGYLPIRPGVRPPAGRPSPTDLKVHSAPNDQLAAERDRDKKDWSVLFGG